MPLPTTEFTNKFTLNILPGDDQEPWDVLQLARDRVGFDLQVQIQVVVIFSLQKSFFPCFILP